VEILVLHPGALGDIILALPAISLLRKAYPAASLTLAGNIDHLDTILNGRVENVLSLSTLPLHRLYTSETPTEADIRFWKSYEHIVSWTGSSDAHFCRNMKAIHADARIASWKPVPEDPRHVSRIFADSLGNEIPDGNVIPARIDLNAETLDQGHQWLLKNGWDGVDPLTAIHPGAGGKSKRWPLSRYIELARRLIVREKQKVIIIEGPAEQGMARQILKAVPVPGLISCEGAGLRLLASILAQCRSFIGNDSGISHLAAALEIPCLVLFGPTLPQHWAPQGERIIVLRNMRGCRGCEAGEPLHTCLENISVDRVIQEFQLLKAIAR
jgi:heptosyltransferase-3